MKQYEEGLAEDAARVAAADRAVLDAGTPAERAAAERSALLRRAEYVRSLAIGWLGRGRIVPGLPLVIVLEGWLETYADAIGAEALDDLAERLGGTFGGAT